MMPKEKYSRSREFTCQLCSYRIIRRDNLLRHIRTKHKAFVSFISTKYNSSFDQAARKIQETQIQNLVTDARGIKDYDNVLRDIKTKPKAFASVISTKYDISFNETDDDDDDEAAKNIQEVDNVDGLGPGPGFSKSPEARSSSGLQERASEEAGYEEDIYVLDGISDIRRELFEIAAVSVPLSAKGRNGENQAPAGDIPVPVTCRCCGVLGTILESVQSWLNNLKKKHCKCISKKNCCCEMLLKKFATQCNMSSEEESLKSNESFLKEFYSQKVAGIEKWVCRTCIKCSSKVKGLWTKGKAFKEKRARNFEMKRHLSSAMHRKCSENLSFSESTLQKGPPPAKERRRATENSVLLGQLMASNNFSYRMIEEICLFVKMIVKHFNENYVNPLGSSHPSQTTVHKLIKALHKCVMLNLKELHANPNPVTKQKRRYAVCADKGTAYNDAERQVIIGTYIDEEGNPKEFLISAAAIYDKSAAGVTNHFKENTKALINTSCICSISTGSASLYTGRHQKMIQQLLQDQAFSPKIIYLPDFWNETERLIKSSMPSWLQNVFLECSSILTLIEYEGRYSLLPALKSFNIPGSNQTFHSLQAQSSTRYAEYAHRHVTFILRNVEVICMCFQDYISHQEHDVNDINLAKQLLKKITNVSFLAALLAVEPFYEYIFKLEKIAQGKTFSPFDLNQCLLKFQEVLSEVLHVINPKAISLLSTGVLDCEYVHGRRVISSKVDLQEITELLQLNVISLRQPSNVSNFSPQSLTNNYEKWINEVERIFSHYLSIPDVVKLSLTFFSFEDDNLTEKLDCLRKLLPQLNIDFEYCCDECSGPETCDCLGNETKKFFRYIRKRSLKKHCKGDRNKILSHFLTEENAEIILGLGITNILRVIETVLLLKASQSSTERIISMIEKTVEGRFEHEYEFKKVENDLVEKLVFLRVNSNILSADVKRTRRIYSESRKNLEPRIKTVLSVKRKVGGKGGLKRLKRKHTAKGTENVVVDTGKQKDNSGICTPSFDTGDQVFDTDLDLMDSEPDSHESSGDWECLYF